MISKNLKVIHNKAVQKFIITLFVVPFDIIFLLVYFFGFTEPTLFDTILMFSIIGGLPITGLLIYFLLRIFAKTYYIFDDTGLHKMKNEQRLLSIEWNQVNEIFYCRMRWLLLLQFGAAHLIVRYDNNRQHEIALSFKQVKLISDTFNLFVRIE